MTTKPKDILDSPSNPATSSGMQSLLKPSEIPRILTIGVRTYWRWVSSGRLPHPDLREGRVVRWRRETVDTWLDSRCW
ncbi:helix-turn-helix domain-containing protein [bacterium]|nr:helix-turn-helix domain-containing protein [bacterium]